MARMGGLGMSGDLENAVHELKTRIHERPGPRTSASHSLAKVSTQRQCRWSAANFVLCLTTQQIS